MDTFEIEGYEVIVGRNARENDRVTFGVARPRDLWLHASGYAGSHVVIRTTDSGEVAPKSVVEKVAAHAAWHSKARTARGKVEVHVCRAADVRKPRGVPPGTVELRRYDVVRVYPREIASRIE